MKPTLIDIRDLDGTWWQGVEAYRDGGILHLPRQSVERLGEIDPATGDSWLVDGTVEARATTIAVAEGEVEVWSAGLGQLTTRPSRGTSTSGRKR